MSSGKCATQSYIYKLKILSIPPAASNLQPLPPTNIIAEYRRYFIS